MNLRKNLKNIKESLVGYFVCDCTECNASENTEHMLMDEEEI